MDDSTQHKTLRQRENNFCWAVLRGVANFGEIFEKSEIGVQIFFFYVGIFFFHYQGAKKQCFVAFPSQSQAVVGDIRKNGQTFSDLNFHKI